MTCAHCRGIERQFNDKVASRELKRFRKSGPRRTTARLIEFIRRSGHRYGSLLDIGGGVGSIQHSLAESIDGPIASVDASLAYIEAARSEAERRHYADRVSYRQADFVDAAESIEDTDLVTLDRVICCYHDLDSLLGAAASKARSAVGLVFPREDGYMKIGTVLANWALRLFGSEFQAFIHPHAKVEEIVRSHGLVLSETYSGLIWRVALFTKRHRTPEHRAPSTGSEHRAPSTEH